LGEFRNTSVALPTRRELTRNIRYCGRRGAINFPITNSFHLVFPM
jgi:hypothetical protein